jgi:hypothetical protein
MLCEAMICDESVGDECVVMGASQYVEGLIVVGLGFNDRFLRPSDFLMLSSQQDEYRIQVAKV